MSVRLNYINENSELIEKLPVSDGPMDPIDFAKINPLLEEGTKILYPLRKYMIILILYIIFSLDSIHTLIVNITPSGLKHYNYVILIMKALVFVTIIFILDNIIAHH